MNFSDHEVLAYFATGLIAILLIVSWYLIREKDRKREEDLRDQREAHEKRLAEQKVAFDEKFATQDRFLNNLFELHKTDADELTALRLTIAEKHYQKDELDIRFDRMEKANEKWFTKLFDKVDALSNTVLGKR